MRPSVLAAAPGFQEKFEGYTTYPYLDVKCLLTVGVGCLIDPPETATELPWVDADSGAYVAPAEALRQLQNLKTRSDLKGRLAGYQAQFTTIRLTHAGVTDLVAKRLAHFDAILAARFPWYEAAPADAQLGTLGMAWAMGPGFQFPKFEAFCAAGDFAGASTESAISTAGNPGVAPRNSADAVCFRNAAVVLENGWDLETLHWPAVLSS